MFQTFQQFHKETEKKSLFLSLWSFTFGKALPLCSISFIPCEICCVLIFTHPGRRHHRRTEGQFGLMLDIKDLEVLFFSVFAEKMQLSAVSWSALIQLRLELFKFIYKGKKPPWLFLFSFPIMFMHYFIFL